MVAPAFFFGNGHIEITLVSLSRSLERNLENNALPRMAGGDLRGT